MAFLRVEKGTCPGQIIELRGDIMVLGRHPQNAIVLDNVAVSRHHARILENHGRYFIEDLRSRNGTYVNGDRTEGRQELNDTDNIKICGMALSFHVKRPTDTEPSSSSDYSASDVLPSGKTAKTVVDPLIPSDALAMDDSSSAVLTTLSAGSGSNFRLTVKPEVKLGAILQIIRAVGEALELKDVLDRILGGLFTVFPQADDGFIVLLDPATSKITYQATKFRNARPEDRIRLSQTILQQAIRTGDAILSSDALDDSRFEGSESLAGLRIRSMMCVPLQDSTGRGIGIIQIDTSKIRQQFSQDDLDVLVSVGCHASVAVENALLHEQVLKQREFQRDLEIARQIQLGFLPSESPQVEGYAFSEYYEAAQDVGGDYFDFIPLPDNRIAVAVGDVAGKGIPAALLMARLYSAARYHLLTKSTPSEAMEGLNTEIASSGLGHRFITLMIAVLDISANKLTLVNAGHLPMLLRHQSGEIEWLGREEAGMPLGIVPHQDFDSVTFDLAVGDMCLFYTDGITEAMRRDKSLYDRPRLEKYAKTGPSDVAEMVSGIVSDVEKFCAGQTQSDDMCLVGLSRTASA